MIDMGKKLKNRGRFSGLRAAFKNKFQNKGYSESGASHKRKALKSYNPISGSAQEDIDFNNYTLRQRGRDLFMSAPVATSAIRSVTTNALKSYNPISGSAQEDIDFNNYTLRQRGRDLFMSAPVATSAIRSVTTNAIGTGLRLQPAIDKAVLGMYFRFGPGRY